MKLTRLIGPILGLAATLSLAACGGGSSNGDAPAGGPAPTVPPPVPTAVTAVGSITGFSSVFVNGTKYEVESDTVIAIEDEAESIGDDSRLRLGMKVRVVALEDNGVRSAQRIEFDEDLKGPIEDIMPNVGDPRFGTFVAVRTLVTVDANTVLDDDIGNNDGFPGIDIRDLTAGMIVEVSGFPIEGGFLATRVDRQLDGAGGNPDIGNPAVVGDELELKGIASIATDLSTITVSDVVFDVADNILVDDGFQLGDLDGRFVEVKADIIGGVFVAVRVQLEDDFGDDDRNGEFEIEGVLQSVDTGSTPNTFTINDITVPVSDASSLLALRGMRVEIKGSFNADGVLVLREAELDVEDNVRTEDLVAPGTRSTSFTTRLGLVITPTGGSRVEDDSADSGDHLTPAQFVGNLADGDRIEVRGNDASGSVTWTRIERRELAADNNDFDCELRGPVTSVAGTADAFSFVIQGVTVSTNNVTDNNFEGANGLPIGRVAFFGDLRTGVVVEAKSFESEGSCVTGALEARELQFEPADDS